MEKYFLLVFALVKESKQGQDKIILLLIIILSPPPPISVFFFEFLLVFQLSVVKPKTTNQRKGKYPMGPMRTQRKIKKTA